MLQGENMRTCPQARIFAPTRSDSRTRTSYPSCEATRAASRPIGPAPSTRRRPEVAAGRCCKLPIRVVMSFRQRPHNPSFLICLLFIITLYSFYGYYGVAVMGDLFLSMCAKITNILIL